MEAGTSIDTPRIRAGLDRLADQRSGNISKKWRSAKGDHVIYRIKVVSSQGTPEALSVLVDCGVKQQPEDYLHKIADQLRVNREDLADVIDNWSKDRFLEHCAKFEPADLKPPSMRMGPPAAAVPQPESKKARKARLRGERRGR